MRKPLTIDEILRLLPGAQSRGISVPAVIGIALDSRKATRGDLFVARKGWKRDGRGFVQDALSRGAAAVLAAEPLGDGVPQVVFGDLRAAVTRLSAALHGNPERRLRFHGVTGTNGKTTTTLLLRSVLEQAGSKAAILGTVFYGTPERPRPSPMTTPDAPVLFAELDRFAEDGFDTVVMEVSSHALAQGRADGLSFGSAVFTNLTRDHLDYHGTMEAYLEAKLKLFRGLSEGAAAAVNADDPHAGRFREATRARVLGYGLDAGEVRGTVEEMSLAGTRLSVRRPGGDLKVQLALAGRYNALNALAAAAAATGLGIDGTAIARGLEAVRAVPGRLERIPTRAPFAVFVDYAHTDDALANVLGNLRGLAHGRVITVFGCGGDRDRGKRPLMARVAETMSDLVVLTSDNPRTEDPLAILEEVRKGLVGGREHLVLPDRREAIREAIGAARAGDCVLIAGKGHEDYQILRERTVHFDDREEALAALAALGHGA